ncbi:phage terminase small subunit [Marinomonas sp. RSW2]|uniref:Phage terminase small subunit n=1 Tax=Marinomonas maritima TaxID=2940935 RepID=A0ABT5WGF6_9GAMM|nr:phage terminase small subunit [Marinomonas maritima]MDE8603904.1 phage terminase small subunit [Marinomonas maritima]
MNLIQQRRLARLAKQNAKKEATKPANKDSKGNKPVVSKLRQNMQKAKADAVPVVDQKEPLKTDAPEDKKDEQSEKLDGLENQVDGVEGSVDDLKNDVESQGEKTDALAGTVDELSNDLDSVKDEVSELDSRVDWVENDIEKIKEKLQDDSEFIGNPELETHKAILAASIDEMLNVEDIEDRKAYKAEAIVKLIDFVNGYVSSAAKYPNIVAVWVMIWLFDLGDIARALPLALHLAKQKIHNMPTRFKSKIEVFICDQMYDWANAKLDANKSAGPYLDNLIQTIESDKWQLPDIVHGKMYAMHGKHLEVLGEEEAALSAFEKAMSLNSAAGVKKKMEKLQASLAKKVKES